MKTLLRTGTAGWLFMLSTTFLTAQEPDTASVPPPSLPPICDTCKQLKPDRFWLWRDAEVTGGQLTLPFKIRRSQENQTFLLTTDVTLGAYVGYTRKIALKELFFVTIPLTAGLTFINLNSSNTAHDIEKVEAAVVPGLTWSTGLILQLDKYSLGLMFGKDYASNVGSEWAYHGKLWWSFGLGFAFLQ